MIKISILYDNRSKNRKFTYGWGFSCLISGLEQSILFDTGARGDILFYNMEQMGIEPEILKHIFLSHIHGDHTGGLISILEKKPNVTVWLPESFPESAKFDIGSYGARVKAVSKATRLFSNVYSTGELGRSPKEQALIIDTNLGLILITGCAHPGVANFAIKAKNYLNKEVYLILGGLHLRGYTKKDIIQIIALLKDIGVKKIAPCHCTGEYAMQLLQEEYKEDYIDVSAGSLIQLEPSSLDTHL